jgi:hypothetical protein
MCPYDAPESLCLIPSDFRGYLSNFSIGYLFLSIYVAPWFSAPTLLVGFRFLGPRGKFQEVKLQLDTR